MAIHYLENTKTFYLESKGVTYAFGINSLGMPEHLYFGRPVGRDLPMGTYSSAGKSHGIFQADASGKAFPVIQIPKELHTPYSGDYHEPSLILEFENGNRRSDFVYESHEIMDKKPMPQGLPGIREGQTLQLILRSKTARVTLNYTVSEKAAAITRSMRVENLGNTDIRIRRAYSFAFSLPRNQWKAMYLAGGHSTEAHVHETPLSRGIFTVDSKRGASSAVMNPTLFIGRQETTENTGPAYGINLIYSGSYAIHAETIPSGLLRLTGGLSDFDFCWKLEPGEAFQSPEAVLCYSDEGFSGLSRQYHTLYRESLIPSRFVKKTRPIVINNWEGTHFSFTAQKLKDIVNRVAGTGIDTFVLDDGWFGKREDATSGLGDWFVNEKKMDGSLKDIIDFTHSRGMRFGLWFEPEMVNRDSALFRAHPDWAIQTPDEIPAEARNQLYLDLSREEVRNYLVNTINQILADNEIDYVKWDCNRDLTEGYSLALPADRQQELFHRQILGLYDLFRRIVEANPEIIFEGCASGGARFDAGILYYFPQIWTSDQTDAPARVKIQYGTSLCYPLSAMSCHVTESPNKRGTHLVAMQSRADIAHLGATGYELDTTKITDEEVSQIPGQIAAYKSDEDLILNGDLYRLASPFGASNHFAVELLSSDKAKGKITIMKLVENFNEQELRLYPKGLLPDTAYYVPELNRTMLGSSWMEFGFTPAFPQGDFRTLVFHFQAC